MGIGSSVHEPLGKGDLWKTKGLQLPAGLQHLAHALLESGRAEDREKAIEMATGIMRNYAEGHDGRGNKVSEETQAKAVKVMAEYDAARAKAHATPNAGDHGRRSGRTVKASHPAAGAVELAAPAKTDDKPGGDVAALRKELAEATTAAKAAHGPAARTAWQKVMKLRGKLRAAQGGGKAKSAPPWVKTAHPADAAGTVELSSTARLAGRAPGCSPAPARARTDADAVALRKTAANADLYDALAAAGHPHREGAPGTLTVPYGALKAARHKVVKARKARKAKTSGVVAMAAGVDVDALAEVLTAGVVELGYDVDAPEVLELSAPVDDDAVVLSHPLDDGTVLLAYLSADGTVIELAERRVRTAEGAARYKVAIGELIVFKERGAPGKGQRRGADYVKAALQARATREQNIAAGKTKRPTAPKAGPLTPAKTAARADALAKMKAPERRTAIEKLNAESLKALDEHLATRSDDPQSVVTRAMVQVRRKHLETASPAAPKAAPAKPAAEKPALPPPAQRKVSDVIAAGDRANAAAAARKAAEKPAVQAPAKPDQENPGGPLTQRDIRNLTDVYERAVAKGEREAYVKSLTGPELNAVDKELARTAVSEGARQVATNELSERRAEQLPKMTAENQVKALGLISDPVGLDALDRRLAFRGGPDADPLRKAIADRKRAVADEKTTADADRERVRKERHARMEASRKEIEAAEAQRAERKAFHDGLKPGDKVTVPGTGGPAEFRRWERRNGADGAQVSDGRAYTSWVQKHAIEPPKGEAAPTPTKAARDAEHAAQAKANQDAMRVKPAAEKPAAREVDLEAEANAHAERRRELNRRTGARFDDFGDDAPTGEAAIKAMTGGRKASKPAGGADPDRAAVKARDKATYERHRDAVTDRPLAELGDQELRNEQYHASAGAMMAGDHGTPAEEKRLRDRLAEVNRHRDRKGAAADARRDATARKASKPAATEKPAAAASSVKPNTMHRLPNGTSVMVTSVDGDTAHYTLAGKAHTVPTAELRPLGDLPSTRERRPGDPNGLDKLTDEQLAAERADVDRKLSTATREDRGRHTQALKDAKTTAKAYDAEQRRRDDAKGSGKADAKPATAATATAERVKAARAAVERDAAGMSPDERAAWLDRTQKTNRDRLANIPKGETERIGIYEARLQAIADAKREGPPTAEQKRAARRTAAVAAAVRGNPDAERMRKATTGVPARPAAAKPAPRDAAAGTPASKEADAQRRASEAGARADSARARLAKATAAVERHGITPADTDPNRPPLGQVVNKTARQARKAGERNDAQLGRLAAAFREQKAAESAVRGAEAVHARETSAAETVKGVTPERLADARMVKAGGSWYEVGGVKPGAKKVKAKGMDYSVTVAKIVDVKTNDDVRRERLTKVGLDPDKAPTAADADRVGNAISRLRIQALEAQRAQNPDLARLHSEHADTLAAHMRTADQPRAAAAVASPAREVGDGRPASTLPTTDSLVGMKAAERRQVLAGMTSEQLDQLAEQMVRDRTTLNEAKGGEVDAAQRRINKARSDVLGAKDDIRKGELSARWHAGWEAQGAAKPKTGADELVEHREHRARLDTREAERMAQPAPDAAAERAAAGERRDAARAVAKAGAGTPVADPHTLKVGDTATVRGTDQYGQPYTLTGKVTGNDAQARFKGSRTTGGEPVRAISVQREGASGMDRTDVVYVPDPTRPAQTRKSNAQTLAEARAATAPTPTTAAAEPSSLAVALPERQAEDAAAARAATARAVAGQLDPRAVRGTAENVRAHQTVVGRANEKFGEVGLPFDVEDTGRMADAKARLTPTKGGAPSLFDAGTTDAGSLQTLAGPGAPAPRTGAEQVDAALGQAAAAAPRPAAALPEGTPSVAELTAQSSAATRLDRATVRKRVNALYPDQRTALIAEVDRLEREMYSGHVGLDDTRRGEALDLLGQELRRPYGSHDARVVAGMKKAYRANEVERMTPDQRAFLLQENAEDLALLRRRARPAERAELARREKLDAELRAAGGEARGDQLGGALARAITSGDLQLADRIRARIAARQA